LTTINKIEMMPNEALKAGRGRPSKRTPDVESRIVAGLSQGVPLTLICDAEDMPTDRAVRDWIGRDAEFSSAIARAREAGHDRIAMDALTIADCVDEDPSSRRVRVDTRLRLLAKWDPKRYGEMLKSEITGANGGPLQTATRMTPEQSLALDSYLENLDKGIHLSGG
jgi:hypothetical protein